MKEIENGGEGKKIEKEEAVNGNNEITVEKEK